MRLHISLEEELVRELDHRAGKRGRSAFISEALRQALDDERRWELIESALGSVSDAGHEWDADAASWVRAQRHVDPNRIG